MAEAKALFEAINLAASRQVSTLVVTDCLSLVNVLKNNLLSWPWDCTAALSTMIHTISSCPWISVEFTPRALNSKADWVARKTRENMLLEEWLDVLNVSFR
ncbi:hypothetical protein LINPERHAP2_LOCUS40271 [Linum perenne]